MITTAAELLKEVLRREREVLDQYKIKHGPTIGQMYEGMTRKALENYMLPTDPPMVVAPGFVEFSDGSQSPELDCVIALGHGVEVPYTGKEIFQPKQVIAVIQIKKSLYGNDLDDGHANLAAVLKGPYYDHGIPKSVVRKAFHQITGVPLKDPIDSLPVDLQYIYHHLVVELGSPVRILLGYHGYKNEQKLREGTASYLQKIVDRGGTPGFLSLPNIIVNQNAAIVKGTGMPWAGPYEDEQWEYLLSASHYTSAYLLLELIWDKMNFLGYVSADIFGDDDVVDEWHSFCRIKLDPSMKGWVAEVGPAKPPVTESKGVIPWEPTPISKSQFHLLDVLKHKGEVDITTLGGDIAQIDADVDYLQAHRIVGRSSENRNICGLLTEACVTGFLPDKTCYVADDWDGRFTRWLLKQRTKHKVDNAK